MPERTDGELSADNLATLDRLILSLDMAEGFALFLTRCNIPVLRRQLIASARERLQRWVLRSLKSAFRTKPSTCVRVYARR